MNLENTVFQIIYNLYPKGIRDSDARYEESTEHKNLLKERAKLDQMNRLWSFFLARLSYRYENNGQTLLIENWEETLPVDHCFKAVAIMPIQHQEDSIRLVINLSVVAPYFVIHQSIYNPASREIHGGRFNKVALMIPQEANEVYLTIKNLITDIFPNYEELDRELVDCEVPDITYDGKGRLEIEESHILPRMTVFNAFFSNRYL